MGVQVYRDISVDFSNGRYILINAKQHDSKSRFIRMTCTNVGQKVNLNPTDYSAFIRYRKSDGYGVFNKCIIATTGEVIFELTEQMLSTVGTSYADLVIIDIAKSDINNDLTIISADGRIIENNSSLASTMTFYINVLEKPLNNWDVESTNEFSALNDLLLKASKDYEYIVQTTKEYMDNAKESENAAKTSESNAKISETNAKTSETNAKDSETKAKESETNAKTSETNAKTSELNAKTSETNAKESETNAKESELKAKESETNAKESELKAKESETNAKESESNAKTSETKAYENAVAAFNSALLSKSYAIGESGFLTNEIWEEIITNSEEYVPIEIRPDENVENAKNYYELSKSQADNAKTSADNASISETNAKTSELNAKTSETNAKDSETNAKTSEANTKISETNAKESETNAYTSETNASNSALLARSYTKGDTNIRPNEITDSAEYYYQQSKQISEGLNGTLLPMGTILFSQLSIQTKSPGYMFNISDDFVSDDTFKDGGGISYPAGTNVYYTADGFWDCLAGTMVSGVKGNAETNYRKGYVNLTPENIGTYSKEEIQNMTLELLNRIKTLEELIESGDITVITKIVDNELNAIVTDKGEMILVDNNIENLNII